MPGKAAKAMLEHRRDVLTPQGRPSSSLKTRNTLSAEPQHRADESLERYGERHAAWGQRCEEAHNKSEVNIAKQRHGPVGKVNLLFEGEFTRFRDLETRVDEDRRF